MNGDLPSHGNIKYVGPVILNLLKAYTHILLDLML